jgi:PAS domain S-box-containing protein
MISYAQHLVEYFRYSRQFHYLILDAEGNLSYANPLFREAFHYSSFDFITASSLNFPDKDKFIGAAKECLEKPDSIVTIETNIKSKHDIPFYIQWEVSAILDDEARTEIVQAIGIKKPRTGVEQMENTQKEIEERFRYLISDLQFGVTMSDAEGRALLCNKMASGFLGLSEKDFSKTTLPLKNVFYLREDGSALPDAEHPTVIATCSGQPVRNMVLGVYKEGEKECKWIMISAEPILNSEGQLRRVITSFIDITERKKLERKLIKKEINRQQIITRATIEGQEKERKEIGKELHDNINQLLTTTQLYLEIAKGTADSNTLEMIQLSSKSVADVIHEIRELSRSLTPPSLGERDLIESVQDLCDSIKTTQVFTIRFYHKDFNEDLLAEDIGLMLFRIIQEQIKNIIKHAEASVILIRLITDESQAMLVISDNGKGFDLLKTKRGLGLNNIMNRPELFNGKAEIRTAPEQGCTIIVTIPI